MQISRRSWIASAAAFGLATTLKPRFAFAGDDSHVGPGPEIVVPRLLAGNARYAEGHVTARSTPTRRDELRTGQYPVAAMLCCSDSRTAPETVFDEGLGNLFIVRVAGNVLGTYGTASLEYAVVALGVRTICVLGHSYCGAVKASLDPASAAMLPGELPKLTSFIHQGLEQNASRTAPAVKTKDAKLQLAVEDNVLEQVRTLNLNPVLAKHTQAVPLCYCLDTGLVTKL